MKVILSMNSILLTPANKKETLIVSILEERIRNNPGLLLEPIKADPSSWWLDSLRLHGEHAALSAALTELTLVLQSNCQGVLL